MAEKGFKLKFAAIIRANARRYIRLLYDPEEPMPHNLTPFCNSMTDLAQQYCLIEFCSATGCDELQLLE